MPIKKKNKTIIAVYAIFIGAIYIAILLYFFHFYELKQLYPYRDFNSIMSLAYEELLESPFSIFPVPGKAVQYAAIGTLVLSFFIYIERSIQKLKKHDNPETVNGDAHWMTEQEFKEYNMRFSDPPQKKTFDGPNNIILSQTMRLNLTDNRLTRRNCNILVLGGSGTGKSFNIVGPNLLQANSSFVVTDPSGDLVNDYGKYLENEGYRVRVFNLVDTTKSSHYNPFRYLRPGHDEDVFIFVNTLIKNTDNGKKGGDPFWEKSETALLCALIFLLWKHMDKKDQKMSSITKLLRMADIDENDSTTESPLDKLFADVEKHEPNSMAVTQYKTFKMGAGKTLKSILISCATRLQTFDLESVQRLTDTDDIDFDSFGDTKQALFIVLPTGQETFNYLAALMYSQLFMSVYDYVESRVRFGYQLKAANGEVLYVKQAYSKKQTKDAKEDVQEYKKLAAKAAVVYNNDRKLYELINGNGQVIGWRGTEEKAKALIKEFSNAKIEKCSFRCPTHIQFYMDEFANIGQVPNFQQKLATIRKYEISCVIILQSLSQLKEMYEKGWQGVTGNCDTTIYLGGNDDETAEWLSKKLGKRTTIVQNESWGTNNTSGNTSFNRSSIELMPASKLLLMPDDDTIVIVRGQRPWYGRKYKCNLHPNYKECMSLEPIEIGAEAERKSKHSKASSNPVIEEKNKKIEETKEDKHDEISASTDENLLSGNDKKSNFKDAMIGFRQKIENLVKKEKTNKGNHEIQASVTLNGQEEENPIEKDMNENKSNVVENAFAVDDIPSLDDIPLDPSASDSMINNSDDFIPEDALLDFPTDNEDPPTFCQTAEDILGMESSMKSDKEWDSTMNKRRKEAAKESSANIDESGDAIISDPEPLSIDNMEKFFGSKDVDKLRETCSSVFNDEEELDMSFAPDEIMYGSTP